MKITCIMTTISSLTDLPPPFIFLFSLDNDRDEIEKYSNALRESQSKNEKKNWNTFNFKIYDFSSFSDHLSWRKQEGEKAKEIGA